MVTTQDIIDDIAKSIDAYPGPFTRLCKELRVKDDTLRRWRTGNGTGRCRPPTEADALRVRAAVRRLLLRALEQLDNPDLEPDHWTRRGTPPGARHGNAVPKKDRQKHESPEATPEAFNDR